MINPITTAAKSIHKAKLPIPFSAFVSWEEASFAIASFSAEALSVGVTASSVGVTASSVGVTASSVGVTVSGSFVGVA